MISYNEIRKNEKIRTLIRGADDSLEALGYTEHSFAHVTKVAEDAARILETLGYPEREVELAKIAGYMHDIGNLVNRVGHSESGAIMAYKILDELGMSPEELVTVVSAIGNHDEGSGVAVNPVAAALILADKCDVRRSRVRNEDFTTYDIHDRVNYSVREADLRITEDKKIILSLDIDAEISAVMDYFEIFLERMIMCRKAAERIGLEFKLMINGHSIL